MQSRCCASRRGQCASRVLLGGLGGQLPTDRGGVRWGGGWAWSRPPGGVSGDEKRRGRDGIFGSSDGAAVMGVGGRREGAWERATTTTPVLAAAVAPAHHTPAYPLFLAGQRIYDGGGCDAGISEIPRFKRRQVRVGGATGQCWRPATHRLVGGRIYHSNVSM
jgi:hypothetical protein